MPTEIKCDDCGSSGLSYCATHKEFLCFKCVSKHSSSCNLGTTKTKKDLLDFVKYVKATIKHLKMILDSELSQLILEQESQELKPYFFEFQILFRIFAKDVPNIRWTESSTMKYFQFEKLFNEMKAIPAYTKTVVFDFEQKLKQQVDDQAPVSSKHVGGNLYSNVLWKKGDKFCISEGVNDSATHSEHTEEHETEVSESEKIAFTKKSKFSKNLNESPPSPEIRIGKGKQEM